MKKSVVLQNGSILLNYEFIQSNVETSNQGIKEKARHGGVENKHDTVKIENIIFLHGWGCDLNIWKSFIKHLDFKSYNLYLIDLPGFGESIITREDLKLEDYATTIREFMEKVVDGKNNLLIGHSFGGRITYKLAGMDLLAKYFTSCVLIAPHGINETQKFKNKTYKMIAKIVKPIFSIPVLKVYRKRIYEKMGWGDYVNVTNKQMQQTFLNIIKEDLQKYFTKVNIPTLLIFGENDKTSLPSYGKLMHSKIPQSKLEIVQSAGHYVFLDQMTETIQLIKLQYFKT